MTAKNESLKVTPRSSLQRLIDGNQRFAKGLKSVDSISTALDRERLARDGQQPFATILTCSDSRVPAELVFDAGLGELFVVRVAGNVVAPSLIASIEFSAMNLGTSVCVVMGHTKCGAVSGALAGVSKGDKAPTKSLEMLLNEIQPAAKKALELTAKDNNSSPEMALNKAIHLNVEHTIATLLEASPELRKRIEAGTFKVVGAVYDIESGVVEFKDSW